MKEEILGGLKNALERGITLEKAAQSFINAGYNALDVQEAVRSLGGVSAQLTPSAPVQLTHSAPLSKSAPLPAQSPTLPSTSTASSPQPSAKKNTWHYVLIGLAIVIVLLIAALIGVIAFSEELLAWLKPTA